MDNFVDLCKKLAGLLDARIQYLEDHITSKDGPCYKEHMINLSHAAIITFLSYNKAKEYKQKMLKDGKYYYEKKTFNTFKQLYLYCQNIISHGGNQAFGEYEDSNYMLDLLNAPCKL